MSAVGIVFTCIGGAALLIGLLFIAREFVKITVMKGYPCESMAKNKYFWYCFLFGIIGYLMVIALPVRPQQAEQPVVSLSDLPDL